MDAARAPRRPRRWPGWIGAAVVGMAFGIGLATQIDVMRPTVPVMVPVPDAGVPSADVEAPSDRVAPSGLANEPVEEPAQAPPSGTGGTDTAPSSLAVAPPVSPPDAATAEAPAPEPAPDAPPTGDAEPFPSAAIRPEEPSAAEDTTPPSERVPVAAADEAAPAAAPAPEAVETVPVAINATPWAVIEVDGEEVGETPLAGLELSVGRHRFVARMPDGTTRERVLRIDAEHDTVVFE